MNANAGINPCNRPAPFPSLSGWKHSGFMYLLTSSPERPGGPNGPSSPWKQITQTLA